MGRSPTRAPNADEQRQMQRRHIFVVNSEPAFLDIVRDLLQHEDYNVTTTNFAPETFAQIAAVQPACLIIDLAVHQRAGWELLERLNGEAATHGIPVIVVSTNDELLARVQANRAQFGGQRFIGKPFDIEVLLDAVEDLIGTA